MISWVTIEGSFQLDPLLAPGHADVLRALADGRSPPPGAPPTPGGACPWVASHPQRVEGPAGEFEEACAALRVLGSGTDREGLDHAVAWLEYLLAHLLGPWGYRLVGTVRFEDETGERWTLTAEGLTLREQQVRPRPGTSEEQIAALVELLWTEDAEERGEALADLLMVAREHPATLQALGRLLREDTHLGLRLTAATELEILGPEALPMLDVLLATMADENEHVAAAATQAAAQVGRGRPDVREALERAARSPHPSVRSRAEQALAAVD